jgi:hypothetical protein
MAYEHKELKGSVFVSDYEGAALSGTVKVKGEEYWITVWKKDEGKTHYNVTLKPKQQQAQQPSTPPQYQEAPPWGDPDDPLR